MVHYFMITYIDALSEREREIEVLGGVLKF